MATPPNDLLHEIVQILQSLLRFPSLYGLTPYAAEGIFTSLLAVAASLETGDTLFHSMLRKRDAVRELTKDIPAYASHAKFLCEERVIPERKASFELLQERGRKLYARLLTHWDDGSDVTDTPVK